VLLLDTTTAVTVETVLGSHQTVSVMLTVSFLVTAEWGTAVAVSVTLLHRLPFTRDTHTCVVLSLSSRTISGWVSANTPTPGTTGIMGRQMETSDISVNQRSSFDETNTSY